MSITLDTIYLTVIILLVAPIVCSQIAQIYWQHHRALRNAIGCVVWLSLANYALLIMLMRQDWFWPWVAAPVSAILFLFVTISILFIGWRSRARASKQSKSRFQQRISGQNMYLRIWHARIGAGFIATIVAVFAEQALAIILPQYGQSKFIRYTLSWLPFVAYGGARLIFVLSFSKYHNRIKTMDYQACISCGYAAQGLQSAQCPECGNSIDINPRPIWQSLFSFLW